MKRAYDSESWNKFSKLLQNLVGSITGLFQRIGACETKDEKLQSDIDSMKPNTINVLLSRKIGFTGVSGTSVIIPYPVPFNVKSVKAEVVSAETHIRYEGQDLVRNVTKATADVNTSYDQGLCYLTLDINSAIAANRIVYTSNTGTIRLTLTY